MSKQHAIHILIIFVFTNMLACAQSNKINAITENTTAKSDSNFKYNKTITGTFTLISVDELGNIYCVNKSGQLKKLNSNGDSVAVFNEVKKYGKISHLDVSNPLKILLYYENFSTVVVLDRFLSFRNSINFRKQNIFKVHSIATSYDNNIWVFDEQYFKLKKINEVGLELFESTDWRQIFNPTPIPTFIVDKNNFVYLYDEQNGFYIFDYYGSFKNKLPFIGWQHVAVEGNTLYGFANNALQKYDLKKLNLSSYKLPPFINNYSNIIALNGKLYMHKDVGIEIYDLQ